MKLLSVDFWKSNTSYVSSNRYKSFIVYNDSGSSIANFLVSIFLACKINSWANENGGLVTMLSIVSL